MLRISLFKLSLLFAVSDGINPRSIYIFLVGVGVGVGEDHPKLSMVGGDGGHI